MTNISTEDNFASCDIKHGTLSESPLPGSTARYICNPIVDDIEADPDEQYQPPSCLVVGEPSVNDLATHRWHNGDLDAARESALIQRINGGDERASRQLLESFHRTIVDPAAKYIPGGTFYRRQAKGQKHTNDLLYEDLTAVGCFALWRSALKFDATRGYRFNTLSRHKVIGAISNEANYLRQRGFTSGDTVGRYLHKDVGRRTQSRLDRWIFDNLSAPPESLLEAQKKLVKRPVYHSLEEAADAIKRANNLQHPDIYSDSGDDDVERDSYDTSKANRASEPLEEYRDVYQSQNPLYWSPQLVRHRNIVSPIVDFWMREFCDPPRIKAKPQAKPVYPPCTVKPTGRVLKPIDTPYWMQPREKQREWAGMYYDDVSYNADRREVATVQLKNGKTKQRYRQTAAKPNTKADNEWWSEYLAHPYRQPYTEPVTILIKERKADVRAESNKANGRASANVIVLEGRRSRETRFYECQQCNPPSIGVGFACQGIAGGR